MADENQGEGSRADRSAESRADGQQQSSQAGGEETISLDEARKLRQEAAGLRKRLKEAESKAQAAEDAKKPEIERLTARLERMAERLRERGGRDALRDAATKAGAPNPDRIFRMLKADLDFDDDGEPTNVDALIAALRAEDPDLFKKPVGGADAGKGRGGDNGRSKDWVREGLAARRG